MKYDLPYNKQFFLCYLLEGKQSLSAGISTFNKTASEKFQNLTEEDKVQLNATQANETTTLTESQIGKKISDIFGKVRDRTVTKHYTLSYKIVQ